MSETTENPRMLAAWVDPDLAEQFREIAHANERSVAAELRILIREHVEVHGKEPVNG